MYSQLIVDETINDDDSVVLLPLDTMQTLQLSHGDPVWIEGKKGRQTFSTAIAYDDSCECDIEPKIRLNRALMNDLLIKIGGFVSVHPITDVNLKLSEFLNNVPDNVLFDVFLRLPNGRSAVQCSSVCKRWSSIISHFTFIRSFTHIHDHICPQTSDGYYSSRPFRLLFVRYDGRYEKGVNDDDLHYFEPFCEVFSEKSKVHHGKMPSNYLGFMPCNVVTLASYHDLVLATSLEQTQLKDPPYYGAIKNYICNPLTKQWLELPEVSPLHSVSGYGLVCEPASCNNQIGCITNVRYRVVIIGRAHSTSYIPQCQINEFVAQVFCSETRQWSELVFSYPKRKKVIECLCDLSNHDLRIAASNGVLYWLEGIPIKGIVAFDPFNDIVTRQCRLINLPVECFEATLELTNRGHVRIGLVNGQLRLSQFYKAEAEAYFVFRVWELKSHDSESSSWVLVYNLKLNFSETRVFVLCFHPNNTSVVFLLCGNDVCQYEISERKYEKVGKLPDEMLQPWRFLSIFTLLYPSWPTPIPALPSS